MTSAHLRSETETTVPEACNDFCLVANCRSINWCKRTRSSSVSVASKGMRSRSSWRQTNILNVINTTAAINSNVHIGKILPGGKSLSESGKAVNCSCAPTNFRERWWDCTAPTLPKHHVAAGDRDQQSSSISPATNEGGATY